MTQKITSLSMSGGTQSVALCLMFVRGEIKGFPCPDIATFADTFDERSGTYRNVDLVEKECEKFGIQFIRCGNDAHNVPSSFNCQSRLVTFPFFTKSTEGKLGMVRRQCTTEFKIQPIKSAILDYLIDRELAFYTANGRRRVVSKVEVTQYIGFTTEEFSRVKPPRGPKWLKQDYPFLGLGITKADCIEWLAANYPEVDLGGSSCLRCPYTASLNLSIFTPSELKIVLEADQFLASDDFRNNWKQKLGFSHDMFLTPQRVRLSQLAANEPVDIGCDSGHCFL